jgi:menaquinone-dependent protoporphyrinogen IX oxidase
MAKILVVYTTSRGTTKKYAGWIADATGADVLTFAEFASADLAGYDAVIVGAPTYLGKKHAVKFLTENWDVLRTKRVFLFTVGIDPPESEGSKNAFHAIPAEIRAAIGFTKLPCHHEDPSDDEIGSDKIAPVIAWVNGL